MNAKKLLSSFSLFLKNFYGSLKEEPEREHKKREKQTKIFNCHGTYKEWIKCFHLKQKPSAYLEIGVNTGGTLLLPRRDTQVIGVDPNPNIKHGFSAPTRLFKNKSDKFFEENDVASILGENADLSFIDGLHEFQQAYRDIINTALISKDDAVILVHDVLPVDQKSASPERKTRHWPGDVYKAIAFIKDNIPSLHITLIYAYPTGLAFITGCGHLKAKQDDLQKVAHVLKDYQSLTVDDYYSDYVAHITQVRNTSEPIHSVVADLLECQVPYDCAPAE